MTIDKFYVPPTFTEPEPTPPPPASAFKRTLAVNLVVDDLVLLNGTVYRVKDIRKLRVYRQRVLTLWRVEGGAPTSEVVYEGSWVSSWRGM